MTYFPGNNCSDCIKAGKNLKLLFPETFYYHVSDLKFVYEELDIDFAGPLDPMWGPL